MKKNPLSESGAFRLRVLLAFVFCSIGVLMLLIGFGAFAGSSALAQGPKGGGDIATKPTITAISSYKNDVSPALRDMPLWPINFREEEHEANLNPLMLIDHVDVPDPVIQNPRISALALLAPNIPAPIINFDGIPSPGVVCNCSPPDTNGAVGATQYVQMVNNGVQVFNKATGASVFGPVAINSIWTGFGGPCASGNSGDPIVMYDRIADRWVISQFRPGTGFSQPTDECIAVSTTSDATGTWNRYGFHLGSDFFDYPHMGVWPDAYYCAFNIFNASGTARLGPQAFAFDRAKMIAGLPATVIVGPRGTNSDTYYLPADLDGPNLPPAGAACPFVSFPSGGTYKVNKFHVDFVTPANSTFTLVASPPAAGFTQLCPGTRSCVPSPTSATNLDGIGDRLMFRLPYRNFGDHDAVVGNHTVNAAGVAGIRWFEMRNMASGTPTIFQESTYAPDTLWRWMGSIAMDGQGNIALGFSASNSTNNPSVRYAGRLVTDPLNTLAQGEATIIAGGGAPSGSGNRWGDYSAMTIDPVDDATFWYTQEYFSANGTQFTWKTRIGSFKFGPVVPANSMASGGSSVVSAGANGVLDPAETVTVSLGLKNVGGPGNICTTGALTGTLLSTGGVTAPSGPQVYGVTCAPGGAAVFRNFTFTVNPALPCGSSVTATLAVTDGATDYGNVAYTFVTGTSAVAFAQNFDGVVAPALPAGWTSTATGIGVPWVTSTTTPGSAPNAAFAPDPSNISDMFLVTPSFAVPAGGAKLSFKINYNTESTFDGAVLEFSTNGGGTWTDITTGGNAFISGAYTGTISTAFASPIAGRQAWNGNSGGYINSSINTPAAANGQPSVQLRWRMACDNSVAATGVRVDDISIANPNCAGSAPTANSIVSRHLQSVTPFDINMPLGSTSTSGVECRRGTGANQNNHQLVLTFASPVTVGSAAVVSSDGLATATPGISGNVLTVDLAAVADAQVLGITLSGVSDGVNLGNINIPMGILLGDVSGDRNVNAADALQTRSRSGQSTDGTNFRYDVTNDGNVNSADTIVVRARSGNALP